MGELLADGELLRNAQAGEEDAFRVLYERHRDAVFGFAYRLLGSTSLAEDVTHSSFLTILRRPDSFDTSRQASLRTYLCAAARNHAFRELRRRGAPVDVEENLDRLPAGGPGPLDALVSRERSERVAEAVARLPPLQREALVLFEYEEMSIAQIAEVTGATQGTVNARLHRARERLRGWLTERTDRGGKP
jgi:RNA polymerase sigma-70 factor (ECF subfamily)